MTVCAELRFFLVIFYHLNNAVLEKLALGNFGVALFFGLSGILSYYMLAPEFDSGNLDYHAYIARLFIRIWPLYCITIFLTYIILYFYGGLSTECRQISYFVKFYLDMELETE